MCLTKVPLLMIQSGTLSNIIFICLLNTHMKIKRAIIWQGISIKFALIIPEPMKMRVFQVNLISLWGLIDYNRPLCVIKIDVISEIREIIFINRLFLLRKTISQLFPVLIKRSLWNCPINPQPNLEIPKHCTHHFAGYLPQTSLTTTHNKNKPHDLQTKKPKLKKTTVFTYVYTIFLEMPKISLYTFWYTPTKLHL